MFRGNAELLSLVLSGLFALFLAVTGHFLPHDVAFLGMSASDLCQFHNCRIVNFMIHDRAAFGGALVAIGLLYLWLVAFPLKQGEEWAWWTIAVSGVAGFASFLAYLGYGYLDTWHGIATLFLLPIFGYGLVRTRQLLIKSGAIFKPAAPLSWQSRAGIGRLLLLLTAVGMIVSGFTIMIVGITSIFVPQDLEFMQLELRHLHHIDQNLVPLIAHDRAGFGGAILSVGITTLLTVWRARPAKSLWQVLFLAGIFGFGCAIGIHFAVGYTSFVHLAPAYLGGATFGLGLGLSYRQMVREPVLS